MIDPLWQDSVWEPASDISLQEFQRAAQLIVEYGRTKISPANHGYSHIALSFWDPSALLQTLMFDKIHRFDKLDKKFIKSMKVIPHPLKEGKMAIHIRVDRRQWFDIHYRDPIPALFRPPKEDKLSPQLQYLHKQLRRSEKIGYLSQIVTHNNSKLESKFYGVSDYEDRFTEDRLKWKKSNGMTQKSTGTPVVCITPPYRFGESLFDIGKAKLVKYLHLHLYIEIYIFIFFILYFPTHA